MGNSFSWRQAVSPMKVVIWNEEAPTGVEMCFWKQNHIYVEVFQLFTEVIALPPNAICNKCCDFERRPFCFINLSTKHSWCSDWLRAGRPKNRSSSPCRIKNFFPRRPDRLWALPNLLSNEYRGLLRRYSGRGVKLTTHLQLVPRSRRCGSIRPLSHTPSWHNA
jgi:hypothetical protein